MGTKLLYLFCVWWVPFPCFLPFSHIGNKPLFFGSFPQILAAFKSAMLNIWTYLPFNPPFELGLKICISGNSTKCRSRNSVFCKALPLILIRSNTQQCKKFFPLKRHNVETKQSEYFWYFPGSISQQRTLVDDDYDEKKVLRRVRKRQHVMIVNVKQSTRATRTLTIIMNMLVIVNWKILFSVKMGKM